MATGPRSRGAPSLFLAASSVSAGGAARRGPWTRGDTRGSASAWRRRAAAHCERCCRRRRPRTSSSDTGTVLLPRASAPSSSPPRPLPSHRWSSSPQFRPMQPARPGALSRSLSAPHRAPLPPPPPRPSRQRRGRHGRVAEVLLLLRPEVTVEELRNDDGRPGAAGPQQLHHRRWRRRRRRRRGGRRGIER